MHLKRLAVPRSWTVSKKTEPWTTTPKSAHPRERTIPINIVLRDVLNIVNNTREAKKIIRDRGILVDGREINDHRYGVGLMDVISIPESELHLRTTIDSKNRIKFIEIDEQESKIKLSRIDNKKTIKNGETQLNLHDGNNLKTDSQSYKTRDTLKLSLPDKEIKGHIQFKEGNKAFIIGGKHAGETAEIKKHEVSDGSNPNHVILEGENQFRTIEEYVIVIGEEEPEVTL
ncbi:30S ribosomal protein S4e [Methanonatronarchaeum sp. AMET6-2]|uniref:30S ribosomal protein S4e n=1 Tax=Methanonatronarchaeum sp. AMET6-2 TaxID=2933293 RepID=UPI00120AB062|nr:30S ribosomal protein S4e [Methanonatronarchaeum sp. AMET6-2]RZN60219.1 MAG: 30S ribosomal protein S4e [Methanonatronarchaeia archaeon]UOY10713.1 30S ribosomal protein S4e [Methanonatronarchaeum sp. AMET6-2]